MTAPGEARRFFDETVIGYAGNECLTWPYNRDENGYGKIRYNGKMAEPHRIACIKVNGPPPSPIHQAAHSCGNGRLGCVNPRHLSWKTPSENQRDRIIHGTAPRKENNGRAKTTQAHVDEIRALALANTHASLAKRFGLSRGQITKIVLRSRWP